MNRTSKRLKKLTAAATASVMLLSGTSSVFAATYQEAEKAALSRFVEEFSKYWDTMVPEQKKGVLTLTLEDSGKTLLSAASGGMDFSWLNTLTMDMTATISEGKETANAAVLLNDAPLCNMNLYMDMADLTEYLQIPELSETWMKIPLLASLEMSEEEMRHIRGNSISMVFQDPMSALNPVYTVGDQIAEAIAMLIDHHEANTEKAKAIVKELTDKYPLY